jgi:hypothetical protein
MFILSYAPELNPVDMVWNHNKYADLANFIPDDVPIRTKLLLIQYTS